MARSPLLRSPGASVLPPLALALVAAVSACSGSTKAAAPPPEASGACPADAPRGYDVTSYELRGSFDWDRRTLVATERIAARVEAGVRTIELDSRVARVVAVSLGGTPLAFDADAAKGLLSIDLGAGAAAGGSDLALDIAYEAEESPALGVSRGRDGDPVTTRVVYTQGEPTLVARWMPGNHRPSDRAQFALELDVADAEEVVSNGARVSVTPSGAGRRAIRYAIDRPIPTYTMAFAAGELEEHVAAPGGDGGATGPRLSVWHRRGAPIDADRYLAILAGTLHAFEARLGPYPFASYGVALLPEFPGGMENTTITFVSETSGEAYASPSLGAHELAHQWFGDAVTVRSWGDVWIKEGLATLLAEEAQRTSSDAEGRGRLFGDGFAFNSGDAIRDCALGQEVDGQSRYTSGPYERAAWLLTQIRARIGDDAFFATLRGVLRDHLDGTIATGELLAAFAPALDAPTNARLAASIDAKGAPTLTATASAARGVTLTLSDPTNLVVAPIEVSVVDASGASTTASIAAGAEQTFVVPEGGYLAIDERDVHPDVVQMFGADAAVLAPYLVPADGAARAAFLTRSASAEETGLRYGAGPFASAAELSRDWPELDSTAARTLALQRACGARAAATGADGDAWDSALAPIVRAPAERGFTRGLGVCGPALAAAAFDAELAALTGDATPPATARLDYVASFDFGAAATLASFGPVGAGAASTALRDDVVTRLALQAAGSGYVAPDASSVPSYQAFFRAALDATTSARRFRAVLSGIVALADDVALPALAAAIRRVPLSAALQRSAVCGAATLASPHPGAWDAFRAALDGFAGLGDAAAQVLADPTQCP